ncbi:MAG TPA: hypothetical protein VKB08_09190, partial [Bradyrhizobium sp.]|nr:hypothetical protein [Bradyrhizobium sp.]
KIEHAILFSRLFAKSMKLPNLRRRPMASKPRMPLEHFQIVESRCVLKASLDRASATRPQPNTEPHPTL